MCVYDDYDGVFFTIQSIRMYHKEVLDTIEFIVVDNNPTSASGQATKKFVESLPNCRYVQFNEYSSTSLRNKIFEISNTPYVLCIDCHILITPNSIKRLIEYFDTKDQGDLLHGPLLWDDLKAVSTHFNDNWGAHMHGQWDNDPQYIKINDHLKNYIPHAYREFHRILSHKEYFSRQDEQDNIKKLETPKW